MRNIPDFLKFLLQHKYYRVKIQFEEKSHDFLVNPNIMNTLRQCTRTLFKILPII